MPFDIFESTQAAHDKGIQSIAIMGGQVPCLTAIESTATTVEETRARYILNFVCQEVQRRLRRFHSALENLFMAPAAFPVPEVISASMDPSAEMIEPRYANHVFTELAHTVSY